MAPEQLEGREADIRTDIFGLGAVLYEMATGRRAFEGKSQASLISAIMTADPPPISTLQSLAPPALDHVVRTCLAKDPDARWQTAHPILVELKWIDESGRQASAARPIAAPKRAFMPWVILATALATALATLATVHFSQRPEEAQRVRFEVPVPEKVNLAYFDFPALSPDGRKYVFGGQDARGQRRLWIHSLDSPSTEPLAGTDGAEKPFWSPDGRFVAFFSDGKLKRMNLADSAVQILCDAQPDDFFSRGSWSQQGTILFNTPYGLMRTSAAGGDVTRVTEAKGAPQFLPDSTHFLYQSFEEKPGIYLGSLASKDVRLLVAAPSSVSYAPPGFLVYARGGALFAQSFDVKTLQVTGEPVQIAQPVRTFIDLTGFSVSRNGVLIYRNPLSSEVQLTWYSREGWKFEAVGEPGAFRQFELSPDEKRLVVERSDTREGGIANLWTLELDSGVLSRQTFTSGNDADAIWSPDGRELIFNGVRNGRAGIYRKAIGAGEEHVVAPDQGGSPYVWLKDGKSIVLVRAGARGFLQLSTTGQAKPVVLFESDFYKDHPRVSRDEHWVAYTSAESGRTEVFVATFPEFLQRQQVSSSGGFQPLWRNDGRELFFLSLGGKLMAAETEVHDKQTLAVRVPRVLFDVPFQQDPHMNQYSVSGDGKRFLFEVPVYQGPEQFTVVLNWQAGLKK
jgi:Tol biopolymer transport system component